MFTRALRHPGEGGGDGGEGDGKGKSQSMTVQVREMTEEEFLAKNPKLKERLGAGDAALETIRKANEEQAKADGEFESLAAKGCIRIGQFVTGIVWAGAPSADIKADAERGFGAEITARGRSKLAEFEAGTKPSTVLGAG